MCGIVGSVELEHGRPADLALLRRMRDTLAHRGPDGTGELVSGPCALGHTRLAIIDLATGDQPVWNADRTLAIVFNGEIYNYRALRERLLAKGHALHTSGDTEVIVHLYEEMGPACLLELRGMFAFAIWDTRDQSLFVARDPLGVKPLFWRADGRRFAFASEIKGLLADPECPRRLDLQGADEILFKFFADQERTIYRDVHRLPPAHWLRVRDGRIESRRYWELAWDDRGPGSATTVDGFVDAFDTSVRHHLESDVPLGVFLSGGIDSTAVLASMRRFHTGTLKSFSVGFKGVRPDLDERARARLVAERYGTEHVEIEVEPHLEELVPELLRAFDEPTGDSGAIPSLLLSREVVRHVKVALTGTGGDEILGGYGRYQGALLAGTFARLPRALREGVIAPIVRAIPEPGGGERRVDWLKRFVASAALPPAERYAALVMRAPAALRRELWLPELQERIAFEETEKTATFAFDEPGPRATLLARMSHQDLQSYLPDCILATADRTGMAAALELRVPFVDRPLVELLARVPASWKIRRFTKKWLARRAFRDRLPREILAGRKLGFTGPMNEWFRRDWDKIGGAYLSDDALRSAALFQPDGVRRIVEEHRSGRRNHETLLWTLVMTQAWRLGEGRKASI